MSLYGGVELKSVSPGVGVVFGTGVQNLGSTQLGRGKILVRAAARADLSRFRLNVVNIGTMPFDGPGGIWFVEGSPPGVLTVTSQFTHNGGRVGGKLTIDRGQPMLVESQLSSVEPPVDFGPDGPAGNPACASGCADVVLARLDDTGKPVWVSFCGGANGESGSLVLANGRLAVAGTTESIGLPISANAPYRRISGEGDLFTAVFDPAIGHLIRFSYAGFETRAQLGKPMVAQDDVAFGSVCPITVRCFGEGWGHMYASTYFPPETPRIVSGGVDASGRDVGVPASIGAASGQRFSNPRLSSLGRGEYAMSYQTSRITPDGRSATCLAKFTAQWTRLITTGYSEPRIGLTQAGQLKFSAATQVPDLPTTGNAEMVALCPDTSDFGVVGNGGELLYGSYVGGDEFDFASAGIPARPGADGKYPVDFAGYRVRIDGRDAPAIAVARGLMAVQVPFEVSPTTERRTIEVTAEGSRLNDVSLPVNSYWFTLFDDGNRENDLQLPRLAALNQDGTVNGPANPAAPGTVVSLFGSGLGAMAPALTTGGVNPLELSQTTLLRQALGGTIEYLGSAPGLSSAVVQMNVRLQETIEGSGIRVHGMAAVVATTPRSLFVSSPVGVIYVR